MRAGRLTRAADDAQARVQAPSVDRRGQPHALIRRGVLGMRRAHERVCPLAHFNQPVENGVARHAVAPHVHHIHVVLAVGFAITQHEAGDVCLHLRQSVQAVRRPLHPLVDGVEFTLDFFWSVIDVNAKLRDETGGKTKCAQRQRRQGPLLMKVDKAIEKKSGKKQCSRRLERKQADEKKAAFAAGMAMFNASPSAQAVNAQNEGFQAMPRHACPRAARRGRLAHRVRRRKPGTAVRLFA
ncbi:hypothetical protein D3C73_896360 [compost metagenome]